MSTPPKTERPALKPNAVVYVTPAVAAKLGSLPAQHVAIPPLVNLHVPAPRVERPRTRAAPRAAPVEKTPAERLKALREARAAVAAKTAAAKAAPAPAPAPAH